MRVVNEAQILANIKDQLKLVGETKKESLQYIGERGTTFAKEQSPIDTGRLRNSMSYTVGNKVYGDGSDNIKAIGNDNQLIIGTNVIYAPSVEYRSKKKSKGFMLRAYKATKKVAEIVVQERFKKRGF